ncbi:MAG: hypothetical protein NTV49_07155 [Kiritimatiellaeota bacterium]|nr:hypothetical protein [Kiritimatiellota bacterium]
MHLEMAPQHVLREIRREGPVLAKGERQRAGSWPQRGEGRVVAQGLRHEALARRIAGEVVLQGGRGGHLLDPEFARGQVEHGQAESFAGAA